MASEPQDPSSGKPDQPDALDRYIETRLTDERLERLWDKMQRTIDEADNPAPTRPTEDGSSLWTTFLLALRSPATQLGLAAICILVTMGILFRSPTTIEFPAASSSNLGGGPSLPRNLRLFLKDSRMELYEGDERIGGTLLRTNAPVGVHSWLVTMRHTNSVGTVGRVEGLLWLTNAPGQTALRSKTDLGEAFLEGTFESAGRQALPFAMHFGRPK